MEVSRVGPVQPPATIDIEILAASDEDYVEEGDIFSDASSVASVNLSKLQRGAILDNPVKTLKMKSLLNPRAPLNSKS